jgi:hypothetical protein
VTMPALHILRRPIRPIAAPLGALTGARMTMDRQTCAAHRLPSGRWCRAGVPLSA